MTPHCGTPLLEELIVATPRPVEPRLSPDGAWVADVAKSYGQTGDHPTSAI